MDLVKSKNMKKTYLIDCGHGGLVNGEYATYPNKMYSFVNKGVTIYEGISNRDIGKYLASMLHSEGIPYEFVNDQDEDTPLSQRVYKANEIHSEKRNCIYISIHSNAASNSTKGDGNKASGFEVYTSVGQTVSDTYADIFAKHIKSHFPNKRFRQDMLDGDADKEAGFYVLRKTACPAVLLECLFYDNYQDALILNDQEGCKKIAESIFNGILEIEKI